jgi:hypothetical protein
MPSEILRPNGDIIREFTTAVRNGVWALPSEPHYTFVDEIVPNEGEDAIALGNIETALPSPAYREIFTFTPHTNPVAGATITKVIVRVSVGAEPIGNWECYPLLVISGQTFRPVAPFNPVGVWGTYTAEFSGINPLTGAPWTWGEIDNLQAGLSAVKLDSPYTWMTFSQIEIEVQYSALYATLTLGVTGQGTITGYVQESPTTTFNQVPGAPTIYGGLEKTWHVILTVTPAVGQPFNGWTVDGLSAGTSALTLLMSQDRVVTASFGTPSPPPPGAVYYVRKDGSDGNAGLLDSAAGAWRTISHAVAIMIAGDTCYVHAGTYNERVNNFVNSGNIGARITLQAFPGERPIIDGSGIGGYGPAGLVMLDGLGTAKNHWTIDGFEITHADEGIGVLLYHKTNSIILKNLIVHDCFDSGIQDYASTDLSTDITIDNCEVYHTNLRGWDEAITMAGVNVYEIKNCRVHDTLQPLDPTIVNRKEGIDCKEGSANGSIHHNEVYNVVAGIYIDTYGDGVENVEIFNNYIHDTYWAGIAIGSETRQSVSNVRIHDNLVINTPARSIGIVNGDVQVGQTPPTFTNIYIYNNTIIGDGRPSQRVGWINNGYIDLTGVNQPTNGIKLVNCKVINNIVDTHLVTGQHFSITTYGIPFLPTELVVDKNIVFSNAAEYQQAPGTNYIYLDPKFVNPATGDFTLLFDSPAIDVGNPAFASYFDFNNVPRPQGAFPDIGAFEFVSGLISISISVDPPGSGTTDPAEGSYPVDTGSSMAVREIPAPGWKFTGWTVNGSPAGAAEYQNLTNITGNVDVVATFVLIEKTILTLIASTGGTIDPLPGQYPDHLVTDIVLLTALPNTNYTVAWWENGAIIGTGLTIEIPMTADRLIQAIFSYTPPSTMAGWILPVAFLGILLSKRK